MTICGACNGTGLNKDALCPVCGGTPDSEERERLTTLTPSAPEPEPEPELEP